MNNAINVLKKQISYKLWEMYTKIYEQESSKIDSQKSQNKIYFEFELMQA